MDGRLSLFKIFQLTIGIFALISLFLSYLYPFHLLPWVTFFNEWFFACFLLFAFVWIVSLGRVRLITFVPWLIVLGLVTLRVLVFGDLDPMPITLWVIFLCFGLMSWVAYVVGVNLSSGGWLKAVLFTLWLAAFASAVIAVMQWSGLLSKEYFEPGFLLFNNMGGRVSSNIGQANNLGTLLLVGIGVMCCAWYSAAKRNLLFCFLFFSIFLVFVFGIYVSGSRAAALNLMIWPVIAAVWCWWRAKPFPWLVLMPAAFLVVLYQLMPFAIEWLDLFPPQEARSMISDANRPRMWLMVLSSVLERPWIGHGFGAVANAHLRLSTEYGSFDYSIAHQAHNTILDMWVNFGVPLGSAIVGVFVFLLVKSWLAIKGEFDIFIFLMACAIIVHGLLEFPLHYGFFAWLLFLFFGLMNCGNFGGRVISGGVSNSIICLVFFVLPLIIFWQAYVRVESVYTLYRQQGPVAVQKLLKSDVIGYERFIFPEPYARLYWITLPMNELEQLTPDRVKEFEAVAKWYPLSVLGWRLAFVYAVKGDLHKMEWWGERMCRMFDPRVCASAAEEWMRRGEENPKWPALPWEKWLPANAVKP